MFEMDYSILTSLEDRDFSRFGFIIEYPSFSATAFTGHKLLERFSNYNIMMIIDFYRLFFRLLCESLFNFTTMTQLIMIIEQ